MLSLLYSTRTFVGVIIAMFIASVTVSYDKSDQIYDWGIAATEFDHDKHQQQQKENQTEKRLLQYLTGKDPIRLSSFNAYLDNITDTAQREKLLLGEQRQWGKLRWRQPEWRMVPVFLCREIFTVVWILFVSPLRTLSACLSQVSNLFRNTKFSQIASMVTGLLACAFYYCIPLTKSYITSSSNLLIKIILGHGLGLLLYTAIILGLFVPAIICSRAKKPSLLALVINSTADIDTKKSMISRVLQDMHKLNLSDQQFIAAITGTCLIYEHHTQSIIDTLVGQRATTLRHRRDKSVGQAARLLNRRNRDEVKLRIATFLSKVVGYTFKVGPPLFFAREHEQQQLKQHMQREIRNMASNHTHILAALNQDISGIVGQDTTVINYANDIQKQASYGSSSSSRSWQDNLAKLQQGIKEFDGFLSSQRQAYADLPPLDSDQ